MTKSIVFAMLGVGTLLAFAGCGETSGSVLERIPEHQDVDSGGPSVPPGTNMRIDVFAVRNVSSCAVGEACRGDDPDQRNSACFELDLDDGTRVGFRGETVDFVSPDDEKRILDAQQAVCYDLVLGDEELFELQGNFESLRTLIYQLSNEEILLDVRIHEIPNLTTGFVQYDNEWVPFLSTNALGEHSRVLSRDTDFTFSVTGSRDPMRRIEPRVEHCFGTIRNIEDGLAGAGYTWLTDECNGQNTLLKQWLSQVGLALREVNGFNDAYRGEYPRCGQAEEDPSRWWPDPNACSIDPDSPTCGEDNCEGTDEDYVGHLVTAHWPRSRRFVGNHCSNGRTDHGETDVDVGGACDALDP